jgi:hypothetical protein
MAVGRDHRRDLFLSLIPLRLEGIRFLQRAPSRFFAHLCAVRSRTQGQGTVRTYDIQT